jgi:hypothetical protein
VRGEDGQAARTSEAAIQAQVTALKRMRRQLAEGLRTTIEMYQRLLDQELTTDEDDDAAVQA